MTLPSIQQLIDAQKAIDAARDLIKEVRKENQDLANTQIEITKRLLTKFKLEDHHDNDDFDLYHHYPNFQVVVKSGTYNVSIEFLDYEHHYVGSVELDPLICAGNSKQFEVQLHDKFATISEALHVKNRQSRERKIQYLQDQLRMLTDEQIS